MPPSPRLAALTLLLIAVVGCREAPGPALDPAAVVEATVVEDDLGRTVAVPDSVARVLTLAPNLTELVYAAGYGARLAAASTADTYPDAIEALPRYGLLPLDTEAVVAFEPNLLLATSQVNTPESVAPLDALGLATYFFAFATLGDIPDALRTLDTLLGGTGGTAAAAAFEARIDALSAVSSGRTNAPSVLVLVGDETLYAFGGASYTQAMVELAGGLSVTRDLDGQQAILSDEFVLQADPDVIAVLAGEDYDAASLVEAHPTFATLSAVQSGRVVGLDPDHFSRPGPRVVLGIEALMAEL